MSDDCLALPDPLGCHPLWSSHGPYTDVTASPLIRPAAFSPLSHVWQLRLAPLVKLEAREGVRQGWSDIITKHLNEGAPLPISISEQTKQVGLGGEEEEGSEMHSRLRTVTGVLQTRRRLCQRGSRVTTECNPLRPRLRMAVSDSEEEHGQSLDH